VLRSGHARPADRQNFPRRTDRAARRRRGSAQPGKRARILIVGLNGAGKTTSSAKLAKWLKKQGKSPLLIALDLHRPAAIEQLATLGKQVGVPVFIPEPGETDVLRSAKKALEWAEEQAATCRFSTPRAGRKSTTVLIEEIKEAAEFLEPQEVLLVADAATGQQAVSVATHFNEALRSPGWC
jgi:signal recognition particle subunit SRP54